MPTPTSQLADLLTPDATSQRLRELLTDFITAYTTLEAVVIAHRDAIRRADTQAMQIAIDHHAALMRDLSSLEFRRCELVARATSSFPQLSTNTRHPITLSDLTSACPAHDRNQLLSLASDLKSRVTRVREITQSLRSATATLLAHMEGLMRHVARQLSHAGTYSRRGVVEPALVISAVDLRS